MSQHKDLPSGSRGWAKDVDQYKARIDELESIVRRMVDDFGLDYSNPTRGVNTGNIPAAAKTVQLKLPALKDLDIRDAVDGDLLTFDGKRGVWVARRHDTVQLPKVFEVGDPDSYYHPPAPPGNSVVLADTWSVVGTGRNLFTDPAFNSSTTGMSGASWNVIDQPTGIPSAGVVSITGGGGVSQISLREGLDTNAINYLELTGLPANANYFYGRARVTDYTADPDTSINPYPADPGIWPEIRYYDAGGDLIRRKVFRSTDLVTDSSSSSSWLNIGNATLSDQIIGDPSTITTARLWLILNLAAHNSSGTFLLDNFLLMSGGEPPYLPAWGSGDQYYFDGNSTDTNEVSFAWDGGANTSTSTATGRQRLKYPASFPAGSTIQVLGEGFLSGASVYIEGYPNFGSSDYTQTVTAGADGTFETTIVTNPDDGPGDFYLYAYDENGSLSSRYTPEATLTITAP